MKRIAITLYVVLFILLVSALVSCRSKSSPPSKEIISRINLKKGDVISCGPLDKLGSVLFDMSCMEKVKNDFNLAMELLHSFEYDESEKVFSKIIDEAPDCSMAYWGVAMCNFHPLWTPPSASELQKGTRAIQIAKSITSKTARESAYIDAIGGFYQDWDKKDHITRCINFEKAMEKLHAAYPQDKEAALFYALALDASAMPTDKTYSNQKKAGAILNALYPAGLNHPGILHYIIHTYDYPTLAALALPAARKYAGVAPSSAHALHMPSHIFTRMGLWDECIQSNRASVSAAQCYAGSAGIKGHWDEELHGLDYLVYAYLQKGQNDSAKALLDYLNTIRQVSPANFKVAYAFAAIPSRYWLENKNWKEAASLQVPPVNLRWEDFPWQEAIIHFTRAMGALHSENMDAARLELAKLNQLKDTLDKQKDVYKARQVSVQVVTCNAWIQFKMGDAAEALKQMKLAAAIEDSTEKHPVTPGEIRPARELLGDMLLAMNQPGMALETYEEALKKSPNRFNGLYGAGYAAEKAGNREKAVLYYRQLVTIAADDANNHRPELQHAKSFLMKHS